MTISNILEIKNPVKIKQKPIKETQDIYIPDIKDLNISRNNGMVYILCGSGGSGKTSLMLNLFQNKEQYRNKFHNIYYFCPMSSFLSVKKHPFEKHDKVYHELTVSTLNGIYNELLEIKEEQKRKQDKKKKKKVEIEDYEEKEESDDDDEIQYSCIIIDDFANDLKNNDIQTQLNKMIIKARHIRCSFITTLQSFFYYPKILRKQITYCTIFKTKNTEEWVTISKELFNYNKDDSLKLYNFVFDEPYNHIDVNTINNKMYKNFNLLEINS